MAVVKGNTSRGSRGFLAQTVLEISGSQLNPLRTFFFVHLKEDITLIRKEKQNTVINIDYLEMRGNNLKSLASIFQVAIFFHPGHRQPKTLANSSAY